MTPAQARNGPLRLCVLASGNGSNLQAVIDAIGTQALYATVVAVVSDTPTAPALQRAGHAGIAAMSLQPSQFVDRAAFDAALFAQVDACEPDIILCAGYLRLIDAIQVRAHTGKLVNIHPSLLPLFKGLRTHQQALEAGAVEHGASVHYVSPELDGGPVIAQVSVAVVPGDDASTLAARVLAAEHRLLVATLQLFAAGRIGLASAGVTLDGKLLARPLQLGATQAFS